MNTPPTNGYSAAGNGFHKARRPSRRSRDQSQAATSSSEEQSRVSETPAPCTEFDMAYFQSYAHLGIHQEMIKDRVRTETYRAAIMQHQNYIAGKVVVDVGCGTGILSIFCAQAGAKRVYAVDASDIAVQANEVVKANNLSDKVIVLHGRIEDVEIDEQVDVIVSEWMGYMLLYESMLGSVITARDRWLKPGGLILPSYATLYMAPVTQPDRYSESIDFWRNVYGIDMSAMLPLAKQCAFEEPSVESFVAKTIPQISRRDSLASSSVTGMSRVCKTSEMIGESKFLSVKELASGGESLPGLKTVDMDKALKGLIRDASPFARFALETTGKIGDFTAGNICSEFQIHGIKSPLDFTLKTTMRVVSASSVNWFHRLVSCGSYGDLPQLIGGSQVSTSEDQRDNPVSLHSWVYPQSSLPPAIIAALTLSAAGGVQMDFFNNRQLAWEDAFRNLYYMLRKRMCNLFYVCTAQFVVMFVSDGTKESKHQCNAYLSQSTRTLRSVLREHDINYSMPLCQSKIEQPTTEDLVEISEMEKVNLGQIRRQVSMSDVDNSSQSLLAFSGNENVHGLYEFLLNHRSFLTSLSGVDVPVLYSPVPFQNASLSFPEVRCKEVKTVDSVLSVNDMKDDQNQGSSAGFYNSIEIKDSYIPPWVISNVCEAMHSKGMSFEASFVTESTSTGLNAGLELFCPKLKTQATSAEEVLETSNSFIPNTMFSLQMRSAYLKGLNHTNGCYTATTSPL